MSLDVLHRISELRKQYPLTKLAQDAMKQLYKLPRLAKPSRFRYSKYFRVLFSAGQSVPQLTHVRVLARFFRLHKRIGHAPEEVMCMVVEPKNDNPLWPKGVSMGAQPNLRPRQAS